MTTLLSNLAQDGWGITVFLCCLAFCAIMIRTFAKTSIEQAISAEFTKGLEKYRTELAGGLEQIKSTLVNAQSVFSHQLEGLTRLRTILRGVVPTKTHPDMDWHEACELIAASFSTHASALDGFLSEFSGFLPNDILMKVESAIVMAGDGRFEFSWDAIRSEAEPNREAIEIADKFYETLREAVNSLQAVVDDQIHGRKPRNLTASP